MAEESPELTAPGARRHTTVPLRPVAAALIEPKLVREAIERSPSPMRLWTVHPCYLDPKGLVAAWREALLAQKVLSGGTLGYRNHPQLQRFRATADPQAAMAAFLHELAAEASRRGYCFDATKILGPRDAVQIPETRGQIDYEWAHLKRKLTVRAPGIARCLRSVTKPKPHPLFRIVAGGIREWEKLPEKPSSPRSRRTPVPVRRSLALPQ